MWVFATVYAYTSYHDDEETEGCLRRAKDRQMEWDGRKPRALRPEAEAEAVRPSRAVNP